MNENTQKLTFGALLVAVFGVLLLLNRQTGGMLEETFIFLFPIPMVAFSARYGFKDSLPVFVSTILISIFCGIFTSAFYAIAQSFIGVVYGSCLHAKRDANRTMLLIMGLSVISNLLSGIVLASLFGISIQEDIRLMQEGMRQTLARLSPNMPAQQVEMIETMLQGDTLLRLLIISVIFTGVLEGFIVCQLSLIILRRLRFPIQKPMPVTSYYPPRWTGFAAIVLFLLYGGTFIMPQQTGRDEVFRILGQVGSLCAYIYLMCFGYLAVLFLLRAYVSRSRLVNALLAILAIFVFPQILMFLGFFYISTGFHDWVVAKMMQKIAADTRSKEG